MKGFLIALSMLVMTTVFSSPAYAGKKDDAWAKCIWDTVPTSANNWIDLPVAKRRQGVGGIKPEFALQHRLQAACAKTLTKEGKSRPSSFNIKKVRKSLIAMKPEIVEEDKIEPMAYVCRRYFLNDKEFKNPAAFRWGYGPDTSKAQFFSMSFIFAAQGGGGVGLPDEGGLEKCDRIKSDGTLKLIEDADIAEAAE